MRQFGLLCYPLGLDMERRGYALRVAYDGSAYHGWQRQPGLRTVQRTIEEGLASLGVDVRLAAAARTDAGVSARGQVVSFRVRQAVDAEKISALQAAMPRSVRLLTFAAVGKSFHARTSAVAREYRYRVPQCPDDLDLEGARRFLSSLRGRQDRRPYVWRPIRSLDAHVIAAEIDRRPNGTLELRFLADRYGRRLVRNWVWAALAIARGEPCDCAREEGWRGPSAPAEGLLLWQVHYAQDPFSASLQNRTWPPALPSNAAKMLAPKVAPNPT